MPMFVGKVQKVISEDKAIKNQFSEDLKLEQGKMHRVILWLRNDLRLHDNAVINWAAKQQNKQVVPVFCFDPRFYQREVKTYGTRKCGLIRTRFDIQSVTSLRTNLEAIGSNLLVACQKPEDFLDSIVSADIKTTVVYQQEICSEELGVIANVKNRLEKKGCNFVSVWGNTLLHVDDLPFQPLQYGPANYTAFRQKTADVKVRDLKPAPAKGNLPVV